MRCSHPSRLHNKGTFGTFDLSSVSSCFYSLNVVFIFGVHHQWTCFTINIPIRVCKLRNSEKLLTTHLLNNCHGYNDCFPFHLIFTSVTQCGRRFSPLSVCLSVCRISQKVVDGFGRNWVGRLRVSDKDEMIQFWWRSKFRCWYTFFFFHVVIWFFTIERWC